MFKRYRVATYFSEYWDCIGPVYFMDAQISFGVQIDHRDGTVTLEAEVTSEQHEAAVSTEGVTYLGDDVTVIADPA